MMTALPYGGFKWITPNAFLQKLPKILQNSVSFDEQLAYIQASKINFFLEVDAYFPREIHDKMKDFPFLPDIVKPPGGKHEKLICHLGPRSRYNLSLEMYLLAKQEGVVFTTIHRVVQYNQSTWLAKYIQLNTDLRKASKDVFRQDYYKLMNNAVYGKTLEDVTKHVSFALFTSQNAKKFKILHEKKPYLVKRKLVYHRCSEHEVLPTSLTCAKQGGCVVGMELRKLKSLLNKPSYVGAKILENSKLLMYRFYYHVLLPKFGSNVRLLATDTDSFILELVSDNIEKDLGDIRHHMDFSNLSKENALFDIANQKVPGKFKLEYPKEVQQKFVGLRSKCYCLESLNGTLIKRAKGTKKSVVSKTLDMKDYEECLERQEPLLRTQHLLRSQHQTIYTVKQKKICLSALDDKRYVIPNSDETLPWGHYAVPL